MVNALYYERWMVVVEGEISSTM